MRPRDPINFSDAGSTPISGEVSSFETSLRDELDLWTEIIPAEDDPSFKSLIERPRPVNRPFEPKDQHCGIWKDAPNKECHASFGDQGTTASVSCFGDLMQMSQFLGAGQSGLFSLDHEVTKEPYQVVPRADDLNAFSIGDGNLSFGFSPDWRFWPEEVPKMKWVNWRWPRYEWNISDDDLSASVSYQWLVKKNTAFQQIVVKNTGTSSIDNFWFGLDLPMLIRDLNYLGEPSYNERNSNGYSRGLGPHDFSWITAIVIDNEKPDKSQEDDRRGDQVTHSSHSDLEQEQWRSKDKAKRRSSDDDLWQTRRTSDTWPAKKAHAVVSIMSVFVDGVAEKMENGPRRIDWKRVLGPRGSSSSVLEITVAYKMIVIPQTKVHWENFLIPAASADVTAMLAAETEQLWGHSLTEVCGCNPSLCDIGISAQAGNDLNIGHSTGSTVQDSQEPSPSGAIEYLTWRHTEHILSVCTIPLSVPALLHEEGSEQNMESAKVATSSTNVMGGPKMEERGLDIPLALTCGDISGHRVCTSASFFAFKFLMDVLKRLSFLKSMPMPPYVESLQQRITAACHGHILWLEWVRKPWRELEIENLLSSGCFAANYWVSGQIMPKVSESWQPDDAVTDTPFQVLKITEHAKWLQTVHKIQKLDDKRLGLHMALLRDVWAYWIHELDDSDKRKAYAWRHASKDGLNTYRLDDHFWLWSALTELHSLKFWSLTEESSKAWRDSSERWVSFVRSLSPDSALNTEHYNFGMAASKGARNRDPFTEFAVKARRLLPGEVRKAVLQRFTVENDVSQERMLAVTRSARETRFFFHTRDTALFYGHDLDFFHLDPSFKELWERTIKSQSHHEEALQEQWESPLRSALGAVAGLKGFSIDRRTSVELVKRSVQALIQASDHNAFIAGEIEASTRKPSIFSDERDRDYYYHVGFEACHILLKYAGDIEVVSRSGHSPPTKKKSGGRQEAQREAVDLLTEILAQLKKQTSTYHPGNDLRALSKASGADGRFDRKLPSMIMKKSMPFNSMIDASSITLLDEEWLYNYPDFLLGKDINLRHEVELLCANIDVSDIWRLLLRSFNSIIDRELLDFYPARELTFRMSEAKDGKDGLVVSLPKQKRQRQRRGKRDIGASVTSFSNPDLNETLWDSIGMARSAADAKKRFVWLPARSDSQTAFLCWLASTEAERPAISLFFDRHAEYDNHLWDDTTMVLNTWQTELHMCFWVLFDKTQPLHQGIPDQVGVRWPRGNTKELRRASIGFRFDGDFFDRYWTCHFIQYVPGLISGPDGIPEQWKSRFENEKQSWQRKVLELQLLQYMLSLMLTGSNEILEDIEQGLGLKKGKMILSVLNTEAYSKSADHWQIYEELLAKADEDITSSLNTLSKWATREEDRGQERPRWTRNDERKYRGYINKLRSQTERQRWDLESSRDKLRKLKETLAIYQAKIRSDLETKREQNIAYFTYVTVIFLPLGFAASFYSMNGAPTNDLIVSLAQFSAAAFAVTAILLFSAGAFIAILSAVKHAVNHAILLPLQQYFHDTREQSLLLRAAQSDHSQYPGELPPAYWKDWKESSWFWPTYLFVELPTRAVSSAWAALGSGTVSAGAVWKMVIGMTVLPLYLTSQVLLLLLSNVMVLLRIPRHLFRLSRMRLAQSMATPDNRFDAEKNITGNKILPDHFKELIPAAKPLGLLRVLELRLRLQTRQLKIEEHDMVVRKSKTGA